MIKDLIPWKKSKSSEVPVRHADALSELHREMNGLFDDFLDDFDNASLMPANSFFGLGRNLPKLEVSETDDAVEVNAELPGLDPKDLDVSLDGNILNIQGEKKEEKEDKKKSVHVMERSYGRFSRSVCLPTEHLDLDKIESKFSKGVLSVKLPKTAEAKSSRRRIEVSG
ncbi:MAG: Hsp20/alpha crystallin family protein [Victivallales bacterium]|nr:Hsp20/alpha crystallin family protein [Victivallales bacterium]